MSLILKVIKAALLKPLKFGSLFYCSPLVAKKLISPLYDDPFCKVLELGLNLVVVDEIERVIKNKENFIGLDIEFRNFQIFKKVYSDFQFHCASPVAIDDIFLVKKFDLIVAFFSWIKLDDLTRESIVSQIIEHLEPGGYFKTYLSLGASFFEQGQNFEKILKGKFIIKTSYEFIKLFPIKIYECKLKK